jgi:tetratricopeptide (TPR) repeat protein
VSKRTIIGLWAAVVAGAAVLFWQYRAQQRAMEQRLSDLQQQVASTTRSSWLAGGQPLVPEVGTEMPVRSTTPDMTLLEKERQIRAVMDEGWRLINERDPQAAAKAAAIFQEGLEKVDPQNPQFFNGLGRALLIAGRPREAIDAWEQGLAKSPQISDMQSGIGWAYWNLRDYYHAREAWVRALEANPKSLDAWTAMAWIYLALGDTEKSKQGFQVLYSTDRQNKNWILGLQMAQARNTDPTQIARFFPLPTLTALTSPADSATALGTGAAATP